jgi:hypothetical protein
MSTAVTPLSRRAAGACVAGAVLTVAGAVVTGIAISSTTVDDDLFGYPFEGAGATTFALAAAVAHLLVLLGLAAGLLTAGWTTLHAGRWQDWRRFTPLACGISVVVLIPVQLTSALWIGVGAYGLCFLALGIALAGRTEPAAVPVPA